MQRAARVSSFYLLHSANSLWSAGSSNPSGLSPAHKQCYQKAKKLDQQRGNFKLLDTSAIALGSRCALWSERTISSDCAPSRSELQYGTPRSLLFAAFP